MPKWAKIWSKRSNISKAHALNWFTQLKQSFCHSLVYILKRFVNRDKDKSYDKKSKALQSAYTIADCIKYQTKCPNAASTLLPLL